MYYFYLGLLACKACKIAWERDSCASFNITLKLFLCLIQTPLPMFWQFISMNEGEEGQTDGHTLNTNEQTNRE